MLDADICLGVCHHNFWTAQNKLNVINGFSTSWINHVRSYLLRNYIFCPPYKHLSKDIRKDEKVRRDGRISIFHFPCKRCPYAAEHVVQQCSNYDWHVIMNQKWRRYREMT